MTYGRLRPWLPAASASAAIIAIALHRLRLRLTQLCYPYAYESGGNHVTQLIVLLLETHLSNGTASVNRSYRSSRSYDDERALAGCDAVSGAEGTTLYF